MTSLHVRTDARNAHPSNWTHVIFCWLHGRVLAEVHHCGTDDSAHEMAEFVEMEQRDRHGNAVEVAVLPFRSAKGGA